MAARNKEYEAVALGASEGGYQSVGSRVSREQAKNPSGHEFARAP